MNSSITRHTLLGAMTGAVVLFSGSLMAAEADLKAEVKGAATSLGDKANYSWRTSTETAGQNGGGGGRMRPGPIEGKTEKAGFTTLSMMRGDVTTEAVLQGDKGAIKTADGWVSLTDARQAGQNGGNGGGPNPARMAARTLRNFKAPAVEASELADKVGELKKVDDAYMGDLTEDAAKELLTMGGGRRGGNAPAPTNAKGWVKFWSKDGVLLKYQVNVQGNTSFNGNDRTIDRTTTTEIRDAGATTVTVSDEAKAKIS